MSRAPNPTLRLIRASDLLSTALDVCEALRIAGESLQPPEAAAVVSLSNIAWSRIRKAEKILDKARAELRAGSEAAGGAA